MLDFNGFMPKNSKAKELYNKWESSVDWMSIYMDIFNRWTFKYKWNNLPETCSERFLENTLFFRGNAAIVDDKKMGKLTLFANLIGMPTVYGEWKKLLATGANGYSKEFIPVLETGDNSKANSVLVRANAAMYPDAVYAMLYSKYLTDIRDSIFTTAQKLKNPYLIAVADDAIKKSIDDVLNLSEQRGKYAVITAKKILDKETIQMFNTSVDAAAITTLWDTYDKLENLLRTQMGENNINNPDKKERMLVDEVNSNNETTDIHQDIGLIWRQKACEQINDLWDLDVSVELRSKPEESDELPEDGENIEEANNNVD